jgi:ABC-type phosphate transport system substrate-binding protein
MKMRRLLAVASGLFWLTSSAVRAAPPDCSTVATKIVYVAGSSALRPLLKNLGPLVAAQSTNNYTIVYQGSGSCDGVNGIANGSYTIAAGSTVNYYPSTYTDPTQPELTCTVSAATALDMGISDVFVPTCTGAATPSGVGDFLGPAQAMAFVVPAGSSQTAITAEEAYVLWGFGGNTGGSAPLTSTPWTDVNFQFSRSNTSGTKRILASVINVPYGKWKGTPQASSGAVFNAVSTSSSAEATIGILGMDYLDQGTNRNSVKQLAIAAYGQKYAYYPDSTQLARDKRNLRDGHYAGLGYAHLIAAVDSTTGVVTKPGVKYLVDVITGKVNLSSASYDPVKVIGKNAGLIPLCAMKVQRSAEGGDFSAYDPAAPCGCYYESLFGTPPASCVSCTTSCATGICRNGYCEAK